MVKFKTTTTTTRDPKTGRRVTTTRKVPIKKEPKVKITKRTKTPVEKPKDPTIPKDVSTGVSIDPRLQAQLDQEAKAKLQEPRIIKPQEGIPWGVPDIKPGGSKPQEIVEFGVGPTIGMFTTAGVVGTMSLISKLKSLGKLKVAVGKGVPAAGKVAVNTKTAKTAGSALSKVFSKKTLAVAGGWASSVFLGQWGQAESTEPLGFVIRDLTKEALKTGDWTLVEEAQAARSEITDLALWEKIMLWSPGAPLIGIPNKIQGVSAAAVIQDKYISDLRTQAETGESDDDKWARLRKEQSDQEKSAIDYYNSERKKLLEWERESKRQGMIEEARFWAKERAKQRKLEEEDRIAQAKFWEAYKKEQQKFQESQRPSKLGFGLL